MLRTRILLPNNKINFRNRECLTILNNFFLNRREFSPSSKDKPQDKPEDKTQDKSKDKPQDKSKDKPQEKSKDKLQDKSKDKAQDKSKDKPQDKSKDKPQDKSKDKSKKEPPKNKDGILLQPVPRLADTIKMFMLSVRPILTDAEFCDSCRIVKKFISKEGEGPKLQALLEERAKKMTNWMTCWWQHAAYLDNRNPVVVHSSPGLVFPSAKLRNDADRVKFASQMIRGAMSFKEILDNKKLPQEKRGKILLDMKQYYAMYGTCRIPGVKSDTVRFHPNSKHVLVMYKNNFFKVPVYSKCGKEILSEAQLAEQVKLVMNCEDTGHGVGILTTEHRDNWVNAFKILMKDDHNKKVFEVIESALFVMCIDGPLSKGDDMNSQTCGGRLCIHGGGSQYSSCNRWFDKTLQFMVSEEGHNGITYEHSPSEGQPVAVITDHVVNHIAKNIKTKGAGEYEKACQIDFVLNSELHNLIHQARARLDKLVKETQIHGYTFRDYGSTFIKGNRMSPDSFIQMAFQLTFHRMHKKPGTQYEAAALRMYADARTETIRGCSIESERMARVMLDHRTTLEERMKSLAAAVNGHRSYTMRAIQGLGCDRHLFGLRMMSIKQGMLLPRIFSDVAFTRSSHMRISTSQVAAKCAAFMIYGPVVPDGYGCCYNPRPNDMIFGITSFRSHPSTNAERYRISLEESLYEMKETCVNFNKKYPPKEDRGKGKKKKDKK